MNSLLSHLMFQEHPEGVFEFQGRWYIQAYKPGFNSPANNRDGYGTKGSAVAALKRYADKGARPLTFGRSARF